jgi:hypothetical protein
MLLIIGYDGYLFMFILCTAQAYAVAASHLVMHLAPCVFQPTHCVSSRLYWLSRDPGTACARAGLS